MKLGVATVLQDMKLGLTLVLGDMKSDVPGGYQGGLDCGEVGWSGLGVVGGWAVLGI